MNFTITDSAVSMYKEEMDLMDGDALRLFVRYAGATSSGYSLGVTRDDPQDEDYKQVINGITFFVHPDDQWFVKNMILDYDRTLDQVMLNVPSLMD